MNKKTTQKKLNNMLRKLKSKSTQTKNVDKKIVIVPLGY